MIRTARLHLAAFLLRAADVLADAAFAVAPSAPHVGRVVPPTWPAPPAGVDPRPN